MSHSTSYYILVVTHAGTCAPNVYIAMLPEVHHILVVTQALVVVCIVILKLIEPLSNHQYDM